MRDLGAAVDFILKLKWYNLKPASIIESILICFCSFSKYSRRKINERERDLYWALQDSKDHREKRKSRVIREWRKVPAEKIKDKNTNRWKRKKEKPIQKHFIFLYVSVNGLSRDVCASQRQTVNWRWYDCAGTPPTTSSTNQRWGGDGGGAKTSRRLHD